MDVVYTRCCGLDVHKDSLVACIVIPNDQGQPAKTIRTFGTMTADILAFGDWLAEHGVTHLAMESTGVYWKPVWNLLEGQLELLLVNARHVKAVPGRKTDVADCEWLADLLRHGLLRGSFVPDRPQRELRELTRYRTALVRERAREANRIQKVLEGANIKLGSVATDILGVSGRAILAELVAGTTDTAAMAELARAQLRNKRAELEQALAGRFDAHQRFLVAHQLGHVAMLDDSIEALSAQIAERLQPVDATIERLDAITGIGRWHAENLLAELGTDMEHFPTAGHCASWAKLCPGNNESAGKRKSGKTGQGNRWLRGTLIEAAKSAGRTKDGYLPAQYRRLRGRHGPNPATVAVAHSILVIVYSMLKHGSRFEDLGSDYFDRLHQDSLRRRLVSRLQQLGYRVNLEIDDAA